MVLWLQTNAAMNRLNERGKIMKAKKIVLAMFASAAIASMTGCFSSSSSSSSDPDTTTESGSVVDWYIEGAFVFADFNDNGVYDAASDVAAEALTDANGDFTLNIPSSMGSDYVIVSQGGTDTATGTPFNGVLKAAPGATAVTPISTLVQTVGDEALVRSFLGLSADADLSADPATSTELFAASQQIVYLVSALAGLVDLATIEPAGVDDQLLTYSNSVVEALSALIAGGATTLDATLIENTIQAVATDLTGAATDFDALFSKTTTILNKVDDIGDDALLLTEVTVAGATSIQDDVDNFVDNIDDTVPGGLVPVAVDATEYLDNDDVDYITGVTGTETI